MQGQLAAEIASVVGGVGAAGGAEAQAGGSVRGPRECRLAGFKGGTASGLRPWWIRKMTVPGQNVCLVYCRQAIKKGERAVGSGFWFVSGETCCYPSWAQRRDEHSGPLF